MGSCCGDPAGEGMASGLVDVVVAGGEEGEKEMLAAARLSSSAPLPPAPPAPGAALRTSFALYDGRSCRGMDHYTNKAKQHVQVVGSYSPPYYVSDLQFHSSAPTVPVVCASSLNFEIEEGGSRDETNWFHTDELSQFSSQVNDSAFLESVEGAQELHSTDQPTVMLEQFPAVPPRNVRPSTSTPQVPDKRLPKKQKTSTSTSTQDFHEKYLKLKQEEIDRFAAIEEKKLDDPYSINNCIRVVEGMGELLKIEEMINAADIFKDNPRNREVFLSFSNAEIRLAWLREQL